MVTGCSVVGGAVVAGGVAVVGIGVVGGCAVGTGVGDGVSLAPTVLFYIKRNKFFFPSPTENTLSN